MIGIIDYGAGNLQSVINALNYIGCDCVVTDNKETLLNCDGAILPGVGSFGDAMDCVKKSSMENAINDFVNTQKPFLGICLGLQLLFPYSEESPNILGLNLLKGNITKIPNNNNQLKIPHMGWNSLDIKNSDGIFKDIGENPYVYFVHSYYLNATDKKIVTSTTNYGTTIDASVQYQNIIATQFHPEKSGKVGLKMLDNFVNMTKSGGMI